MDEESIILVPDLFRIVHTYTGMKVGDVPQNIYCQKQIVSFSDVLEDMILIFLQG
jgi:hypothetical protein